MKASLCKNERQERSDRRKTGRKGSGRKKILLDDYRDLFTALIFSCVCSSCTLNLNTNLKQDSYEWEKRRRERWRTSSSVASSSSSNFFAVRKKIVQVLVFCNRWRPWQWWSRPLTLSRPSAFVAKVFFPIVNYVQMLQLFDHCGLCGSQMNLSDRGAAFAISLVFQMILDRSGLKQKNGNLNFWAK